MASGTIKGPIQVSEIRIGSISMASGELQVTKTFSYESPAGYKRILVSPHISNTTSSAYATLRQFLYTIDTEAKTVTMTINRDSGGSMAPSIFFTAIDIPV